MPPKKKAVSKASKDSPETATVSKPPAANRKAKNASEDSAIVKATAKASKTPARKVAAVGISTAKATASKTAAKRKTYPDDTDNEPTVKKTKTAAKRKADPDDTDDEPIAKKPKTAPAAKPAPKKVNGIIKKVTKIPATKKVSAPSRKPESESKTKAPKKATVAKPTAAKIVVIKKPTKAFPIINTPPTQRLDIYVFGEGSAGELGLGSGKVDGKSPVDVKRPRLNPHLSAKDVGVVQLAVGGMHCAALTHDNKILTWGVNDQGALGRETPQDGKMKDIIEGADADSDSDSEEGDGLNPNEAEPREIDTTEIEEGTVFAGVFAGDSTTFALTTDGRVYGWGTFRGNDGILGFRQDVKTQYKPLLISELKNITSIACGTNHVLALDTKGKVFTWGAGEQNQLARRVVSRTAMGALVPREFGLGRKQIVHIGAGDYHSFAIDRKGELYSWGLNTFGQTGVPKEEINGEEDNTVQLPTIVKALDGFDIKQITGGAHHTLACTEKGEVLIWGRIDNNQGGIEVEDMPRSHLFVDESGRARYLVKPTQIPDIEAVWVATGNDTCVVIDKQGKAHSWGFSSNYQTGQGTDEDIAEATLIDNTAVRGKKLVFSGVGGQFGVVAGLAEDADVVNGI